MKVALIIISISILWGLTNCSNTDKTSTHKSYRLAISSSPECFTNGISYLIENDSLFISSDSTFSKVPVGQNYLTAIPESKSERFYSFLESLDIANRYDTYGDTNAYWPGHTILISFKSKEGKEKDISFTNCMSPLLDTIKRELNKLIPEEKYHL